MIGDDIDLKGTDLEGKACEDKAFEEVSKFNEYVDSFSCSTEDKIEVFRKHIDDLEWNTYYSERDAGLDYITNRLSGAEEFIRSEIISLANWKSSIMEVVRSIPLLNEDEYISILKQLAPIPQSFKGHIKNLNDRIACLKEKCQKEAAARVIQEQPAAINAGQEQMEVMQKMLAGQQKKMEVMQELLARQQEQVNGMQEIVAMQQKQLQEQAAAQQEQQEEHAAALQEQAAAQQKLKQELKQELKVEQVEMQQELDRKLRVYIILDGMRKKASYICDEAANYKQRVLTTFFPSKREVCVAAAAVLSATAVAAVTALTPAGAGTRLLSVSQSNLFVKILSPELFAALNSITGVNISLTGTVGSNLEAGREKLETMHEDLHNIVELQTMHEKLQNIVKVDSCVNEVFLAAPEIDGLNNMSWDDLVKKFKSLVELSDNDQKEINIKKQQLRCISNRLTVLLNYAELFEAAANISGGIEGVECYGLLDNQRIGDLSVFEAANFLVTCDETKDYVDDLIDFCLAKSRDGSIVCRTLKGNPKSYENITKQLEEKIKDDSKSVYGSDSRSVYRSLASMLMFFKQCIEHDESQRKLNRYEGDGFHGDGGKGIYENPLTGQVVVEESPALLAAGPGLGGVERVKRRLKGKAGSSVVQPSSDEVKEVSSTFFSPLHPRNPRNPLLF